MLDFATNFDGRKADSSSSRWGQSCFNFVLIAICICNSTSSQADEGPVSRNQVDELIRCLNAPTLGERSRAERQILDLGPVVLKKLPAPELIDSTPVRESIRRIRKQLELQAAKESSRPSHVSLKGEFSIGEILSEIMHQTGNEVLFADQNSELRDKRLAVDWEADTFWNSLDDLCERAKLEWKIATGSEKLQLFTGAHASVKSRLVQHTGPFRLAIEKIEVRDVIGEQQQRLLRVNGRLSIEPRLWALFLSVAASDLKAKDDQDRPLLAWNRDAKYELPVREGAHDVPVAWDFRLSGHDRLNHFAVKGRLHCQIAASVERIVFDQTSQTRGTLRRRGGVTVRMREVTFNAAGDDGLDAEIGVAVSYDNGGPAFESHRTWIFHNAVYLETVSGKRTSFTEFETTQQSDGTIAVDYRWHKILAPASQYVFVYEAPTLIIDVPIEISIDKIPFADGE
jgi:hypothetical protein